MSSKILIVGGTGQQGSATIQALLANSPTDSPASFEILALTRSATSKRAQSLSAAYGDKITLVEGSPTHPDPIFQAHPDITSVFLVTVPHTEEAQATPMIDASVAHEVQHIVFSSVDRGGDEKSWGYETPVAHFAAKCRIEEYLRNACKDKTATRWTILRPTGFMDNYAPGTSFGMLMWTLWATMPQDRKMQLISTRDIGVFAARVLREGPDAWAGKAIGLASDSLSFGEAEAVFKRVVGQEPPRMWSYIGSGLRWAVGEASASMKWFEDVGFATDVGKVRSIEPGLYDFESWLRIKHTGRGEEVAE
jgi:uncharacterized protein YbjT (DUF2867 family)